MTNKLSSRKKKTNLVTKILEEPELVAVVQALDPRTICRVIQGIGLEDAGEIVAMVTTEQLVEVFDEDLWHLDAPGQTEAFDSARFMLWLEILYQSGAHFAAQQLAQMDEDFATFAISRQILVINLDELALPLSERRLTGTLSEEDLVEKALESTLSQEFDELLVISKSHDGWDAILDLLLELDRLDHEHLRRILERCCAISSDYIEDNGGLYDVLNAEEMLETDVAADREERRGRAGFISPADAKSFLQLARVRDLQELIQSTVMDPITQAYFRAYAPGASPATENRQARPSAAAHADRIMGLLRAEGLVPDALPALLPVGEKDQPSESASLRLRVALQRLEQSNPLLHSQRLRELSYLANVLIAGCPHADRRFRSVEAAKVALATANLGAEYLLIAEHKSASPFFARLVKLLHSRDCVHLFSLGWHLLYHKITTFSARLVIQEISQSLIGMDQSAIATRVRQAISALQKDLAADRPWSSGAHLMDLHPVLAPEAISLFQALIAEYPTIPATAQDNQQRPNMDYIAAVSQLELARQLAQQAFHRPQPPSS